MEYNDFFKMSEEEQVRWVNEHSAEECNALLNALFNDTESEVLAREREEQRQMEEISKAVAAGSYSGVTSDGREWRLCFDCDCHVYYDGEVII